MSDDGRLASAATTLAATHPWIRVVQGPRRGPAANRNAGVTAARGEWLAFTDDDTEPSPGWLAAFTGALAEGTDVYEGRTTCDGGFGSPMFQAPVNETGGWLWSCNFMVSARAFAAVGGFDEGFRFPNAEDQDLRDRLRGAGFRMVFVPGAVVNHPPRRVPGGARLGAYREADVRYMYKHGAARPVWPLLLRKIARHKLNVIRDTPKSLDTLLAFGSLARELWYTARHVRRWEAKYDAEFPRIPARRDDRVLARVHRRRRAPPRRPGAGRRRGALARGATHRRHGHRPGVRPRRRTGAMDRRARAAASVGAAYLGVRARGARRRTARRVHDHEQHRCGGARRRRHHRAVLPGGVHRAFRRPPRRIRLARGVPAVRAGALHRR